MIVPFHWADGRVTEREIPPPLPSKFEVTVSVQGTMVLSSNEAGETVYEPASNQHFFDCHYMELSDPPPLRVYYFYRETGTQ